MKFDLTWNEEQTILRYNESCDYTLDLNSSVHDPTKVNITTINLPLMVKQLFHDDCIMYVNNYVCDRVCLFSLRNCKHLQIP